MTEMTMGDAILGGLTVVGIVIFCIAAIWNNLKR